MCVQTCLFFLSWGRLADPILFASSFHGRKSLLRKCSIPVISRLLPGTSWFLCLPIQSPHCTAARRHGRSTPRCPRCRRGLLSPPSCTGFANSLAFFSDTNSFCKSYHFKHIWARRTLLPIRCRPHVHFLFFFLLGTSGRSDSVCKFFPWPKKSTAQMSHSRRRPKQLSV